MTSAEGTCPNTDSTVIDGFAKKYLHNVLQDKRATMLWKLEGLPEYDARRPLTTTGPTCSGWSST